MSALQQLSNRVAANRARQADRLRAIAHQASALVEVVATDPTTGLTTVRDAGGGVRQVAGLEGAPACGVITVPDGLYLG